MTSEPGSNAAPSRESENSFLLFDAGAGCAAGAAGAGAACGPCPITAETESSAKPKSQYRARTFARGEAAGQAGCGVENSEDGGGAVCFMGKDNTLFYVGCLEIRFPLQRGCEMGIVGSM